MNKLFIVKDLNQISVLKKLGINNFVYPLFSYCVGTAGEFKLKDIKEDNAYLFVNRILDEESANSLNNILHNLSSNIKGIIFDDVGIIEMLKDVNIEKIIMPTHFACNKESVNIYLNYVDSIILPFDITESEIDKIISNAKKKVSLFVFGLIGSAYSKRKLLTNYSLHENVKKENPMIIQNNNHKFIIFENKYGSYFYHLPYFNGLNLLNKDIKYALYHPILLEDEDLKDLVSGTITKSFDDGFLNKKTIYKVKGGIK